MALNELQTHPVKQKASVRLLLRGAMMAHSTRKFAFRILSSFCSASSLAWCVFAYPSAQTKRQRGKETTVCLRSENIGSPLVSDSQADCSVLFHKPVEDTLLLKRDYSMPGPKKGVAEYNPTCYTPCSRDFQTNGPVGRPYSDSFVDNSACTAVFRRENHTLAWKKGGLLVKSFLRPAG